MSRAFGEDAPTIEIPRQTMAELIEEGRRLAEGTGEVPLPQIDGEDESC